MNTLEKLLGRFLALLLFVMVMDVSWQVITRFLLAQPSSYTEELARYLLVWIGLLGAAYAYRTGAHLGLDIVTRALAAERALAVALLAHSVSASYALIVMVLGGIQLVQLTFALAQVSAALQINLGYVYLVLPLSGVLICVFAIDKIRVLLFSKQAVQAAERD
ncbi:TRAP transporter small permease [Teredinibacter turnerae]|uniref:TRAP transporter small permease n=1 Tax=Teredinibacter turnerae TaxID=2426 RepID=UPI00039A2031|nr:TRAP transporter small permease [Teredinibacter turnerae]